MEDQAVFEAIRNLSVVKEDPAATPEDVRLSEDRLHAACASRRYVSENTKALRLYWWTADMGWWAIWAAKDLWRGAAILHPRSRALSIESG